MANYIETAAIVQKELDKAAVAESCTGWMDANAGDAIYNGGKEIKIPSVSMDGLADYDKVNGFTEGDVNFSYQTVTMTQDRGRGFTLDATTTDETNYAINISKVMGEFQREHVVPEIDAYRLSSVATTMMEANKTGVTSGLCIKDTDVSAETPSVSVLKKIKKGIAKVREKYSGPLMIQISTITMLNLEVELAGKMSYVEIPGAGLNTKVPAIDMCPLVVTPADRMVSAITLKDGKTSGQEAGGWGKAQTAIDINFLILPSKAPVAVSKLDNFRIFDPDTYQKAHAWHADYRRYHDIWIPKNKLKIMYGSFAGDLPASS